MNTLYSTITYCSLVFLLSSSFWFPVSSSEVHQPIGSSAPNLLMPAAQTTDSLALVALYQSAAGAAWTNRWILSQPVHQWFGVELDAEGYVTRLQLNNNNLQGTLPNQIGDFSRIGHLQLDNNDLSGNIPNTIGQLSQLTILFLDDNDFTGVIPEEMGNIVPLQTLFLDNNRFSGAIPQSFTGLFNLWTLDIFNNQIDSLPDLSGINLQRNRFRVFGNRLTFDDIVPNVGRAMGDNYINQDSFFQKTTLTALTGQPYVIDLAIDEGISNSQYQWYKDGLPFGPPRTENKLRFTEIDWSDAGTYRCEVTNPDAPLLTLYSRDITLQIACGHSFEDLLDTLCSDEQRVIRGVTFNASNPSQDIYMPGEDRYGCDSTLRVTFFIEDPATATVDTVLCPGETLLINGRTYDTNNRNGTERLFGGAANGCDSIVTVRLDYYPEAHLDIRDTLCTGGQLVVNGTIYDESRPSGVETVPGGSQFGCDSTITIQLQFSNSIREDVNPTLCPDGFITVNGTRYDSNNPSGQENLQTQQGCDSTIYVQLSFFRPSDTLIQARICENEQLIIGGESFNFTRPNGQVILRDQNGCDSTITVALQIDTLATGNIRQTLCYDDSLIVNGTAYHRLSPSGSEILPNASVAGCDSVVIIDLLFHPSPYAIFEPEICEDDIFIYNGRIYDENNRRDTVILAGRATGGCDSIVDLRLQISSPEIGILTDTVCANEIVWVGNRRFSQNNPSGTVLLENNNSVCDSIVEVNLFFRPLAINYLNDTLCDNETLTINGTVYDANQPRGMELLRGATPDGCDSTIVVNLFFQESQYGAISDLLCDNEHRIIGGERFDRNNPSGTVTIPGAAPNGCDSVILVNFDFAESNTITIGDTLCPGEFIFVNGTQYDAGNPFGQESIPTGNIAGCDSTVFVNLSFYEEAIHLIRDTLCPGEFLMVNGIRYDENRTGNVERIAGGSYTGCDSLIDVRITYHETPTFALVETLCQGSFIQVNGTRYDEQNPSGREVLAGASQTGCDSTVTIDLSFYPENLSSFSDTLCAGDFILINGTRYDSDQPAGTEIFPSADRNGCDSTVQIALHFLDPIVSTYTDTLCTGDFILIDGQRFDEARPQGEVIFANQSQQGCDSILQVDLFYFSPSMASLQDTICEGESLSWQGRQLTQSGQYYDTLMAQAQNGCDSILQLDLFVIDPFNNLVNPAGVDQNICDNRTRLSAQLPAGMIGTWMGPANLSFADASDPSTLVSGLLPDEFNLVYWTIRSSQCQIEWVDSLVIEVAPSPIALPDSFTIRSDQESLDFNVLINDDTETLPSRELIWLIDPEEGQLEWIAGGKYRYFRAEEETLDQVTMTYEICSEDCIELCDTAEVVLQLEKMPAPISEEVFIPNGITPNQDGVNDAFIIPILREQPDRYPNSEFIVFNRWGQIVYQQDNYQNDWEGTDNGGKDLAAGTYYYVLRLDTAADLLFKGDVTIVR